MSAFDNLKNKAAELADQAKEQLAHATEAAKSGLESAKDNLESVSDAAIEKAGDAVDAVTGGKFADKVDAVQAKADDLIKGREPGAAAEEPQA
ncbi:MAG: antitoxin [Kineosporiaceae bacterium]|nr:antitoxin [Kineosporiaceae bacterium]